MDNNTKLEQITNFILQNNNNEFSIQAFLKKIILEGINFTDDNVVYLAERFGDKIDVETFVFILTVYNELIENNILLSKNEIEIDKKICEIIDTQIQIEQNFIKLCLNSQVSIFNNIIPKTIAIKHHIRNKKINGIIDENPLYSRIITTENINDVDSLLQQYIKLSKKNKKPYYIHYNDGKHSRFFIIQNGKFAYIDSIMYSEHTHKLFNISNRFGNCFLGSQNIIIQSKLGCRIYTGLGMVILDEYIKKYGIENLEELSKQVEFSKKELNVLDKIINIKFTEDELINELGIPKEFSKEYLEKIESLINIRKELRKKEITKEEKVQLQELEIKVINNIKTSIQNTINQEKQENEDNISLTKQSLLKLLQFIDPERKSIDIDKDFEEIILLFDRVDLVNNKVFSLTHLLFPLAQTMTLVNSYIDHNEKLKESDIRIKDIKDKVKVNHFVNDFREDILSRFNKIKELSKKIDEQKLQDMKFFETPIDKLPIDEEKEEIEEEGKTTQETPYPDFVSQNGNEYIVALLEAVISSREMFERYNSGVSVQNSTSI